MSELTKKCPPEIAQNEAKMRDTTIKTSTLITTTQSAQADDNTDSTSLIAKQSYDQSNYEQQVAALPTTRENQNITTTSSKANMINDTISRTVPRRKVSVFAPDGFPNIQLLEQQQQQQQQQQLLSKQCSASLETESSQQQQQQQQQQAIAPVEPMPVCSSSAQQSSETTTTTTTNDTNKARRSARSDTLGSTGSSRASSCDEPTIVALAAAAEAEAEAANRQLNDSSSSTTQSNEDTKILGSPKDTTSANTISASSSNSSLDSISWTTTTSNDKKEANDDHLTNKLSTSIDDSKVPLLQQDQPFESIKTQIKRNSIPNAQYIQRHIDNLISQNEAIIDNWNLVSIRSYNSSRSDASSSNSPEKSLTMRTAPMAPKRNHSQTILSNSGSSIIRHDASLVTGKQLAGRPSKRWSTTALGGLQQLRQQHQALSTELSSSSGFSSAALSSRSSCDSNSGKSNVFQQQSLNLSSLGTPRQKASERKHSYNLSKRSSAFLYPSSSSSSQNSPMLRPSSTFLFSPMQLQSPTESHMTHSANQQPLSGTPSEQQQQQSLSSCPSSMSMPSSPKPANSLLEIQRYLNSHLSNGSLKDPAQLESAIQNLSIRRPEETQFNQQQQQQQLLMQQHLFNSSMLSNSITAAYDQLNRNSSENNLQHSPISPSQGLMLNGHLTDDHIATAAILFERQRQQLLMKEMQLEQTNNHATELFRQQQQQLKELQLDQLRLGQYAATIEQQQQRMAAMAQSIPNIISSMQHSLNHEDHCQTQQPTPLESHLISEFLNNRGPIEHGGDKAEPHHHHYNAPPIHQYLKHGDEMLTQSLDSATPAHRCEACDISFWTRDLLNYHLMTQCTARTEPPPAKPLAFNFFGPNNYDLTSTSLYSPRGKYSKSVSPPRKQTLPDEKGEEEANKSDSNKIQQYLEANSAQDLLMLNRHQSSEGNAQQLNDLSILKQQLLTQPTTITTTATKSPSTAHESLPLKKRKISEPNMRY